VCTPASGCNVSSAVATGAAAAAGPGAAPMPSGVAPVRASSRKAEEIWRVRAAAHHLGHQIRRGDADGTAARLEPHVRDAAVGRVAEEKLNPVAAHRVVAAGGRIETFQLVSVARPLAVLENHFLVEIGKIVEHQAKNSRTLASASASESISSAVV
jgi:hypothetical protein